MTKKILFIALLSTIFSINASSYDPTQELLQDLAWQIGHIDFVKYQVKAGADINVDPGTHLGNTRPLHYAALYGFNNIAAYLIDQGAKLNLQTHCGETPLSIAISNKNTDLALLLIEKGADVKIDGTLFVAIHHNLIDLIVPLVKHGFDTNLTDGFNETTPLHEAVNYGRMEITRILLFLGANGSVKDRLGYTPLHIAVMQNNLDMVKLLLKYLTKENGEHHD